MSYAMSNINFGRVWNGQGDGYQSLDMQKFAAEIEVSEEVATYEIPWDSFKKFERETDEENNIPSNGLVLITTSMPETGLTVGRVDWLDD